MYKELIPMKKRRNDSDTLLLTGSMKLADLLDLNYNLLGVLSRVGLRFGFGDDTVDEACRKHGINAQTFLLMSSMIFIVLTGAMFFAGTDILLCMFVLSTAAMFLYFAATVTGSPYSTIGASRELIQTIAYEPAVLMSCVGFYLVDGSFEISEIASSQTSSIMYLPGVFAAFIFILTIKMRKSPFDISTSHHAHQEIVKGVTSEMGARNLAIFTVTEWYENVFLMGVVGLFIVNKNPVSIAVAVAVIFAVFFLEILIDNTSARMKQYEMLKLSWVITLVLAGCNIWVLMLMIK